MKRISFLKLAGLLLVALAAMALLRSVLETRAERRLVSAILSAWSTSGERGSLTITYPRGNTLFPPEIAPPAFLWDDEASGADLWLVAVRAAGLEEPFCALVERPSWRPEPDQWQEIKARSLEEEARVTVLGVKRGRPGSLLSGASVAIRTSRDEVGSPVLYRDLPLPFIYAVKNPDTIRWRLGSAADHAPPPVVLENLPVCGNCHSFDREAKVLGMDVDYANDKGSYAIAPVSESTVLSRDRIITWSDYRREDGELTFGLLSQVSPDGRYVVSTVKDRSVFVERDDLAYSQLFFPIKGRLAIYDRETKAFSALPGADDPAFVQSNASWSPCGTYLVFARAPAVRLPESEEQKGMVLTDHLAEDYLAGRRSFRYDLYRIPFNNGRGGTAEPIPGASDNGVSNFFPRISPDGKWLVFTQAKSFMLLQPDSQLYIMPAQGGTPRRMTCNTPHMNSWHSWSPNGRWLVFVSKARGAYTQLYLTHVDGEGNDTPPVLLEHLSLPGRAANIPEFVNLRPGARLAAVEEFLDDYNFMRQGEVTAASGDAEHSLKFYNQALEMNPDSLKTRLKLAASLRALGRADAAEEQYREVGERLPSLGPGREKEALAAHWALADHHHAAGRLAEAERHLKAALAFAPEDPDLYSNIGQIRAIVGGPREAEPWFRRALERAPDHGPAHLWLALALEHTERAGEAREHFRAALRQKPRREKECFAVVQALLPKREFAGELDAYLRRFLRDNPKCAHGLVLLGKLCLQREDPRGAIRAFEAALELDPDLAWIRAKLTEIRQRLREERR